MGTTIKEVFTSEAGLIPDYEQNVLTVRIHSLSMPRANKIVEKLCEFLNDTKTKYPYTNMMLSYETIAKAPVV